MNRYRLNGGSQKRELNGQSHKHGNLIRQDSKHLWGKAVLLIGNDTAVLQGLVTQLAQKGADIALLCWRLPSEIGRKLQAQVQSLGRQLLLVQWADRQNASIEQLIHYIVEEWGRLDIFIDVSAKRHKENQSEEQRMLGSGSLPSKWQLTHTILEEMVSS